jgi:transcriptional regulator with XRE-family HTH domain
MAGKRVPDEAKVIGANIRTLRQASGLSQQQVGRVLGLSYQQVQKYECGLNRFPLEKLFTLKQFYNVPYEAFFSNLDIKTPPLKTPPVFAQALALGDAALRRKIEKIVLVLLDQDA